MPDSRNSVALLNVAMAEVERKGGQSLTPGQVIDIYRNNKTFIDEILRSLWGLIHKKKTPTVVTPAAGQPVALPTATTPQLVVVAPSPVVPTGTTERPPSGGIASIHTGWFVEKTGPAGDGTIAPQGEFGGDNAIPWGHKIHLNGSPFDVAGVEVFGDAAWALIPKVNDGYIFTEWEWDGEFMGGPIDFGSVEDNRGCTPTVKAHKKDESEFPGRHELKVWQLYAKGTPQEVRGETLVFAID